MDLNINDKIKWFFNGERERQIQLLCMILDQIVVLEYIDINIFKSDSIRFVYFVIIDVDQLFFLVCLKRVCICISLYMMVDIRDKNKGI